MSEYGTMRFDGGTIGPDIGGRSYTGGGLGSYSGGSSGKRPLDDDQIAQLLKNLNTGTPRADIRGDGGAAITPIYRGGYSSGGSGSYSSGNPICCIGLIIVIIAGLVLNFVFHFDLVMIAIILIVLLIIFRILAAIFD